MPGHGSTRSRCLTTWCPSPLHTIWNENVDFFKAQSSMFVEVSRDRRSRLKGIERVWYQFTNFESVLLDRMDQNGLRLIHLGCCHEFHYLKERHWLLKSTFFSGLFIVYWLGFVQGLASFSVKIVATGSVLIAQIHWCIHWCIHPSIHLLEKS